jgi:hypothetical protein
MMSFNSVTGQEACIQPSDEGGPRAKETMWSRRRARIDGLGCGQLVVLASMALLFPVHACAQRSRVAPTGLAETAAKPNVRPSDSNAVKARQLAQKIVDLCRRPQLAPAQAAEILGSRPAPPRSPNEVSTKWSLQPTELFVEAIGGVMPGGDSYMSIVPRPSLGLAFEDFVPLLLDSDHTMVAQRSHPWHDSLATMVENVKHVFRVEVGELIIEVPTTVPKESPNQEEKAIRQGLDAATGSNAQRNRVRVIYFGSGIKQDWETTRTLRQLRDRRDAPGR